MDLSKALAPKTDQIDATDLIGKPPQVFTIRSVSENGSELADQQPVNIRLEETNLYWRPSKGMLRVMADDGCWGKDVKSWAGRKVELYGDPNVYFGKEKRGGTRISRMSHISGKKTVLINPRGGRGAYWSVDPLPDTPPALSEPSEADVAACTDQNLLRDWYRVSSPDRQAQILARKTDLDNEPGAGETA